MKRGSCVKKWLGSGVVGGLVALLWVAAAHAETAVIDVRDGAGLQLLAEQGQIMVSTWDRPQIRIDSVLPVHVTHRITTMPGGHAVTVLAVHANTPDGRVELPQEQFVVAMPPAGTEFDSTMVHGNGPMQIIVPASLAYFGARLTRGLVHLSDLKATFLIKIRRGAVALDRLSGEGFVQVLEGPITARDSTFTRLRARTGTDDIVLERCRSKQIEVMSVGGTLVYDDGSFEPGLAHFESTSGSIAIGVSSGGAQIGGQTGGQIFAALDRGSSANVQPHEVTATLNGGGPYVTVASATGSLYLYNGSFDHGGALAHRPNLPPEWGRIDQTLHRLRALQQNPLAPPARRAAPGRSHGGLQQEFP